MNLIDIMPAPQRAGTEAEVIARVAADLRKHSGQTEPAFSTQAIVETCFPTVFVTGGQLPDGVDELVSVRAEGPVIVYSRRLAVPSQRFAIAHAIAHLLFDDASAAARPGRLGIPHVERRADSFAAELLAPLEELRPYVARGPSDDPEEQEIYLDMVDMISSHFVLPSDVIDRQIRTLLGVSAA